MALFFGGLVVVCALVILKQSGSLRPTALRVNRITAALSVTGAVGLLLSSAALYITYRPYAKIFERFIRAGDMSHVQELSDFLGSTQALLGAGDFYKTRDFIFYFWAGVTVLAAIGLLLMTLRHFFGHRGQPLGHSLGHLPPA